MIRALRKKIQLENAQADSSKKADRCKKKRQVKKEFDKMQKDLKSVEVKDWRKQMKVDEHRKPFLIQ